MTCWSFALAQPCFNKQMCVHVREHTCMFGMGQLYWFYQILSPMCQRHTVFQSDFPGHGLHLPIPLSRTFSPPSGIAPSPVSDNVLRILQDQVQMQCLHEAIPDCFNHSFFTLNFHDPSLYFSYACHTLSSVICVLTISCKLLENMDNF